MAALSACIVRCPIACGTCQNTSAYVSIRQHTSAYVDDGRAFRLYRPLPDRLRYMPEYVSICQHTSAYVDDGRAFRLYRPLPDRLRYMPEYISIRQHT
jgi:hypothetical protein